jgi:hypothetical protein
MRAITEREAFLPETVISRICLDSIRRFASLSSRDLLARFLLGVSGRQSRGGSKTEDRNGCSFLPLMPGFGPIRDIDWSISGTQFWSDHGQAVPTTIFLIELRGAPDRLRTGRWPKAIASFLVRPSILPVLIEIDRLSSRFSHVSAVLV